MNKMIEKTSPVFTEGPRKWTNLYPIAILPPVLLGGGGYVDWQKFYRRDVHKAAASLNRQDAL